MVLPLQLVISLVEVVVRRLIVSQVCTCRICQKNWSFRQVSSSDTEKGLFHMACASGKRVIRSVADLRVVVSSASQAATF
jgi:hypothetical protein